MGLFVYKPDGSAVRIVGELEARAAALHNGVVDELPFQGTFDYQHPVEERHRLSTTPGPGWLVDQQALVWIRCRCGRVLGAIAMHSIDADGTVRGPLRHSPEEPSACGWRASSRLAEWIDGEQQRGELKKAPARLALFFGAAGPPCQ